MLCNGILFYFYLLPLIFYNVIKLNLTTKEQNNNNYNNFKHKNKSYQPKLEFLKTQKIINLKRRCNKKIKIHQNIEREREREPFVRENYSNNEKE